MFCTRFKFLLLAWLGMAFLANCQSSAGQKPKAGASLEEQATFFVKSIVAFDFKTSVDYYLPEFVESMGGREALIQVFSKDVNQYKADGTKLSGGKAYSPTAISKCNGTMQCVLRQEIMMDMSYPGSEPFKMESNLIAVSTDNGVTWKFLQAGPDDLNTLRKKYPILCEDLVLQKY